MVVVMNLLPYEAQVLIAFITPVDPEIVYVAWSVGIFWFWKATLFEGSGAPYLFCFDIKVLN